MMDDLICHQHGVDIDENEKFPISMNGNQKGLDALGIHQKWSGTEIKFLSVERWESANSQPFWDGHDTILPRESNGLWCCLVQRRNCR
jgi:hypothetical protein